MSSTISPDTDGKAKAKSILDRAIEVKLDRTMHVTNSYYQIISKQTAAMEAAVKFHDPTFGLTKCGFCNDWNCVTTTRFFVTNMKQAAIFLKPPFPSPPAEVRNGATRRFKELIYGKPDSEFNLQTCIMLAIEQWFPDHHPKQVLATGMEDEVDDNRKRAAEDDDEHRESNNNDDSSTDLEL